MRLCLSSSLIQIFRISRYHSCQHEISKSSPSQLRQSLLKPLNIMCGPNIIVKDDEDSREDTAVHGLDTIHRKRRDRHRQDTDTDKEHNNFLLHLKPGHCQRPHSSFLAPNPKFWETHSELCPPVQKMIGILRDHRRIGWCQYCSMYYPETDDQEKKLGSDFARLQFKTYQSGSVKVESSNSHFND